MGAMNSCRIDCPGIEMWRSAEMAMAMAAEVAEVGSHNVQEDKALHLQQLPTDWHLNQQAQV